MAYTSIYNHSIDRVVPVVENIKIEIDWIGNNIAIMKINYWRQCHKSSSSSSSGYLTTTRWSKD